MHTKRLAREWSSAKLFLVMKLPLFHPLLLTLTLSILVPSGLHAGGGNRPLSVAEIPTTAIHYTQEPGIGKVGRSVQLDVAYVSPATITTAYGAANLQAFTYFGGKATGSALVIAGDEAEAITKKYGTEQPDKKDPNVRTRSLRLEFLGLHQKAPVFIAK